jgi:DNA polymerase III subunit delta'
MLFKDLPGHEVQKETLIRQVHSARISHAQLFFGPEGSGVLAAALAYSTFILCTNKQQNDACGVCNSCVKANKLIHPDMHIFFPIINADSVKDKEKKHHHYLPDFRKAVLENPFLSFGDWGRSLDADNKQGQIGKDEVVEMASAIFMKPYEADTKIFIIWLAEKMNNVAANKLLKALEEPPDQTLFILVSEDYQQLLPTILSRLQQVKFLQYPDQIILEELKKISIEGKKAQQIALLADGNLNTALTLAKESGEDDSQNIRFRDWMRFCFSPAWDYSEKNQSNANRPLLDLGSWIEELVSMGRENLKGFVLYAAHMIRQAFLINQGMNDLVRLTEEDHSFMKRFSPYINPSNCEGIIHELSLVHYHLGRNAHAKMLFHDATLKIYSRFKEKKN